jgi:hypothetical protein
MTFPGDPSEGLMLMMRGAHDDVPAAKQAAKIKKPANDGGRRRPGVMQFSPEALNYTKLMTIQKASGTANVAKTYQISHKLSKN